MRAIFAVRHPLRLAYHNFDYLCFTGLQRHLMGRITQDIISEFEGWFLRSLIVHFNIASIIIHFYMRKRNAVRSLFCSFIIEHDFRSPRTARQYDTRGSQQQIPRATGIYIVEGQAQTALAEGAASAEASEDGTKLSVFPTSVTALFGLLMTG